MLLLLSHLCGVRLMLSLFFYLLFSFLFLSSSSSFMFDIVFLLCCYLLFVFVYSFLVIQSDLEKIFKNCDENFHCKHVLIVKDYGKLGILYDKNLADLLGAKKKTCSHNGRQAFSNPLKKMNAIGTIYYISA